MQNNKIKAILVTKLDKEHFLRNSDNLNQRTARAILRFLERFHGRNQTIFLSLKTQLVSFDFFKYKAENT